MAISKVASHRLLCCISTLYVYILWDDIDSHIYRTTDGTHFISNVYIVHSFQHWHIQHITHVIKAETKKKKL